MSFILNYLNRKRAFTDPNRKNIYLAFSNKKGSHITSAAGGEKTSLLASNKPS